MLYVFDPALFDIYVIYQRFFSILLSTVESFISHKKVSIPPRDKPWTTGRIRQTIRERDRLISFIPNVNRLYPGIVNVFRETW